MSLTVSVEVGSRQLRAALLDPHDLQEPIPPLLGFVTAEFDISQTSADPDLVEAVTEIAIQVAGDRLAEVDAIGISCAASVDNYGRISLASGDLERDLRQFGKPLQRNLRKSFNPTIPIAVANRANMAAWAEYKLGHGQRMNAEDIVFLIVGGTVGAGLIAKGRLNPGHSGFAGQLGHMLADSTSDVECAKCHEKGCLASLAGGAAMLKRLAGRRAEPEAQRLIEHLCSHPTTHKEDAGQRLAIEDVVIDARALVEAATLEDARTQSPMFPMAREIMMDVAEPLGAAIGRIVNLLDPQIVVVGGILANASYLDQSLADAAWRRIPRFRRTASHLRRTRFSDFAQMISDISGDEGSLYGAAYWVWDSLPPA